MQWLKIWSGVNRLRVIFQICQLLTELAKMIWSLSLSVLWKGGGGWVKEKMSQGSSLVAGTPRLPQCYLQRVAYKEPVMKHSHMGSLPLIPRGKGYFSLCLPVFCCWPAHSLFALGLQRRFGCLPGFEEDSPLRDCVTDTEMLMRALLS